MRPLFNHSLISSFALYLDNQLCDGAQAYQNVTTGLFPMVDQTTRSYAYASPFKEWVADSCVSGAVVASGVWNSSGQFLTRESGIVIDFLNGRILTNQKWGPLSGSFARKEYNIYPSTEGEVEWWLEKVFGENQNITYTPTGIPAKPFAAPCIILTNSYETNEPWALGGVNDTKNTIRAYVISKGFYQQEGVNSYMRDMATQSFSLVSYGDVPYTASGDLKAGQYCYSDLCAEYGAAGIYIEAVHGFRLSQKLNRTTSFGVSIVEFDLSTIRQSHMSK